MAGNPESLAVLDSYLTELYSGAASNQRLSEIHTALESFQKRRDAWKHSLYFLSHTSNHYVAMFSLGVIENTINKSWIVLSPAERLELRCILYTFIMEHRMLPAFLLNKLVKLVVDIARFEWPENYSDFYSNIISLIHNPETTNIGLIFLLTTSEELTSGREDITVSRREELKQKLLKEVPHTLALLTNLLQTVLERQTHTVTATPPPSPTQRQENQNLFSTSPVHSGSLLTGVLGGHKQSRIIGSALPPLEPEVAQVCGYALQCLSHLFSWIPLSSHINPALLAVIFHYAAMGVESQEMDDSEHSTNRSSNAYDSLGVQAMGVINEILYKNCVPSDFEDFLLLMFQSAFHILRRMVEDVGESDRTTSRLDQLDDKFVDKFTEFLHLFMCSHLKRFEGRDQFPVREFLALVFKFTFQQPRLTGFLSCLETWTVFLEYLLQQIKDHRVDRNVILQKYKEPLLHLTEQIVRKMQFVYNRSQLEELDDQLLDDEEEAEWPKFLNQVIETLYRIAEIIPDDFIMHIMKPWGEATNAYANLKASVQEIHGRPYLVLHGQAVNQAHDRLKDLCSFLLVMGRLVPLFTGDDFERMFKLGHAMMGTLEEMASFNGICRFYTIDAHPDVLKADLIEVHAHSLSCLQSWCQWLAILFSSGHSSLHGPGQLLLVPLVNVASTAMTEEGSTTLRLYVAAGQLLVALSSIRHKVVWDQPAIQKLFEPAPFLKLPEPARRLLYRSLCQVCVLPWSGATVQEQKWDIRREALQRLLGRTTQDFQVAIKQACHEEQNKTRILNALHVMSDLAMIVRQESSQSKAVAYYALQEQIHIALQCFPLHLHQHDVCDALLTFFLAILDGLQSQMGASLVEQSVQMLLNALGKEQLARILEEGQGPGLQAVEKFLRILDIVMQEPASSFKRFVDGTLTLCMNYIYPIVAERSTPDIKIPLFGLLHTVLHQHWRHFFKKSAVLSLTRTLGSGFGLGQTNEDVVEHVEQLTQIMQIMGQAFLQPDIGVFRQSLATLESLHLKCKLYEKTVFKQSMLPQFLTVLLQVLLCRSHELLRDEIAVAIYNMASVNFEAFYGHFLGQFLVSIEGLSEQQRQALDRGFERESDMPSFTQSVHKLVNDLRCYQLWNAQVASVSS